MAIFNGKIHYKWPFSIAMLVHQRVMVLIDPNRLDATSVAFLSVAALLQGLGESRYEEKIAAALHVAEACKSYACPSCPHVHLILLTVDIHT